MRSRFWAISEPSGGTCGGSELSESDGLIKHPGLAAAEELVDPFGVPACEAGWAWFIRVLLHPLPFWVCVEVEAMDEDVAVGVPGTGTVNLGSSWPPAFVTAVVVVGGFMLIIGRISGFRLPSWCGLVGREDPAGGASVSWSSFLTREVVEASRLNRHF